MMQDAQNDLRELIRTIVNDELGIVAAVTECEKVSDEISDGIKAAMPCDCRAAGMRGTRCGSCGQ